MSNLIALFNACCELVDPVVHPELVPSNGVTHCNQAVDIVASRLGYSKFKGLVANQIIQVMDTSSEWGLISMESAQDIANMGKLVIAGEKGDPHGHVCIIRPGLPGVSGRWKSANVPMVINIGRENFIGRGLNWAFQNTPKIYVWRGLSDAS